MSLGYEDSNTLSNDEVERKPMSKALLDAVSSDESFDDLYMVSTMSNIKVHIGTHRANIASKCLSFIECLSKSDQWI